MHQSNAQLGLDLKQQGQDAVELSNIEWVEAMRREARKICMASESKSVTSDDLRNLVDVYGEPANDNAWGTIFRGKHWQWISSTRSTRPEAHGRRIGVWRWVA